MSSSAPPRNPASCGSSDGQTGPDEIHVAFAEPRSAITPGQSVVLYEGERVMGVGWIE